MAKFIYKMQNILDIKYKLEDQAKSNYAVMSQKLTVQQDLLKALIVRKKDYDEKLRTLMTSKLDMLEIASCKHAIEVTKEYIRKQAIEVRVAEKNLELARQKLADVMVDRKTHEILRENAFEEFIKELEAGEKREIDEIVSYRFNKTE